MSRRHDAHEEAQLWNNVLMDLRKLPDIQRRAQEHAQLSNELQSELRDGNGEDEDDEPSDLIDRLRQVYERGLACAEQEERALQHSLENLGILIALRHATESFSKGEAGVGAASSSTRKKRKLEDPAIEPSSSPVSSARSKRARSASADSTAGQMPPPSTTLLPAVGSLVAYRLQPKARNAEYEYIQCIVTRITGEGTKNARYEIRDVEPDESHQSTPTYRTTASNLIVIPPEGAPLAPFPNGSQVLARYPETTTFYRAEVTGTKRDGTCRLRFEGEEEEEKETEVERRLVLRAL